jgi:hypothetical protein
MDWATVLNTLIATLPAILIALGTLVVALRTKSQTERIDREQSLVRSDLGEQQKKEEVKENESNNDRSTVGSDSKFSWVLRGSPRARYS